MSLVDAYKIAGQTDFLNRVQEALLVAANAVMTEAANDVQTLTITGAPTGGTFTLTYQGQTTAPIPFNATAGQVQLALQALSNVGSGNVAAINGPLPGTGVVVTFVGTLGHAAQPAMTHTDSLTGGSSPAAAIAHTTIGNGFANHANRAAFALNVLTAPATYAQLIAPDVSTNATIQTDFPAPNYVATGGTVDNDIQFVVNQIFGNYAQGN